MPRVASSLAPPPHTTLDDDAGLLDDIASFSRRARPGIAPHDVPAQPFRSALWGAPPVRDPLLDELLSPALTGPLSPRGAAPLHVADLASPAGRRRAAVGTTPRHAPSSGGGGGDTTGGGYGGSRSSAFYSDASASAVWQSVYPAGTASEGRDTFVGHGRSPPHGAGERGSALLQEALLVARLLNAGGSLRA